MSEQKHSNPAEQASEEALQNIFNSLKNNKSFVLNAGAGAGKTYSLIKALKYVIEVNGVDFKRNKKQIACITFTNIAKEQVNLRTDKNPIVFSETIHSFAWEVVKGFQAKIIELLPGIGNWAEKLTSELNIKGYKVNYELGFAKIGENEILLHHDDVIEIFSVLMKEAKFRIILKQRFPVIFIDEYQDTNKKFVNSLVSYFIDKNEGPLIGFFGDPWQKIYGSDACGEVNHANLLTIGKKANFRSVETIVRCLNNIRAELPQEVRTPGSTGDLIIYDTNSWKGERRTEAHWKGDLPSHVSHSALEQVKIDLLNRGWDFSPDVTKILLLTHNLLATEQGYKQLADVFDRADYYIKREDDYIDFFSTTLEPATTAFLSGKYGNMFHSLGKRSEVISNTDDKRKWSDSMKKVSQIRETGTVGEMIDHLLKSKRPRLPEKIERKEKRFSDLRKLESVEMNEDDKKFFERLSKLRLIPFKEITSLTNFVEEMTPFATQHGVKGAEFENVLVVFGRGWNQYNFNQMLEWVAKGVPASKKDSYERNRNLFYVVCSRAKTRLALLFTHDLSEVAVGQLNLWFNHAETVSLKLEE